MRDHAGRKDCLGAAGLLEVVKRGADIIKAGVTAELADPDLL
jgi:hypothetical protein